MLNRAFSTIQFKAIDEETRTFEGVATTPTPDRIGDIMEPKGAEFQLPIPLLWQHDPKQPIGEVTKATVTKDGIKVSGTIVKVDEPGKLKDRIDEAWQSMKLGLVKGLSIGFKPIEFTFIESATSMAIKHIKWLWLELSAVTIPANGEASITRIKAIGNQELTALGLKVRDPVRLIPPGASGLRKPKTPKEGEDMKTLAEQITALEATRVAKTTQMEEVAKRSLEAGETMNAEEATQFDDLQKDIEDIDANLKRLKSLEALTSKKAKPIQKVETDEEGSDERGGERTTRPRITMVETKLAPGIRMARVVKVMGITFKNLSKGIVTDPVNLAKDLYRNDPVIATVIKANVLAGSTASGNWADGLVGAETTVFADFVEFLRPQTILGKFGTNGIPALRQVPFRVALVSQTGGGSGYWVGEGNAKPLTSFDFGRTTLEPLKVANICVLTDELVRDSSPSAELIVRDSLVAALKERMDLDFINPDKAASANVSPAGILNGVTAIPSSGNDADAIRADIGSLLGAFIDANNPPTSGVLIMSARTALVLSLMRNPLGQKEFPDITMNGGFLEGLPVITSEYVTPNTTGDFVALINASDVYFSDDGGFTVDMSREASLEMSDAPAHNSTTPTAAQLVSMFQTNSVAFRAERTVNWKRRRTEGVAWLSNVHWGQPVT